jgi:hypothetical protein
VWIDLAQLLPIHLSFVRRFNNLVILTIKVIHVGYHFCEVSPELNTMIANFLYLLLHLCQKSLKLLDIGKLLICVAIFVSLSFHIGVYHRLVSEYGELLIEVRTFLLSDFKFVHCCMYVLEIFEEKVCEQYVYGA